MDHAVRPEGEQPATKRRNVEARVCIALALCTAIVGAAGVRGEVAVVGGERAGVATNAADAGAASSATAAISSNSQCFFLLCAVSQGFWDKHHSYS